MKGELREVNWFRSQLSALRAVSGRSLSPAVLDMERQLKHHEKRLLKKVNFLDYKRENTARENAILRRYLVQRREDYIVCVPFVCFPLVHPTSSSLLTHDVSILSISYHKLAGAIQKLATMLSKLNVKDPFREKMSDQLLEKLYVF